MTISRSILTGLILPSILVLLSIPALAQTESLQEILSSETTLKKIESDTAEISNKNGIGILTGNVKAITTDDMSITCERLEIYYEYVEETEDILIKKMIATEDVKIDQPDRGISATAEKVEYNKIDEKVVFTGNPVLMRGESVMNASVIIYDVIKESFSFENLKADLVGEKR